MSPLKPLPYHFVDSSSTAAGPSRVSANADSVAAAVDVSTIETDVRYLAAPELQGRLRGTEGNARARAQIVASLEAAGLAPLFSDSFERPTYPNGGDREPYAINVGTIYRAPDRDARWIVLVAHYDHRGVIDGKVQAGADDNASLVALVSGDRACAGPSAAGAAAPRGLALSRRRGAPGCPHGADGIVVVLAQPAATGRPTRPGARLRSHGRTRIA